MRHSEYGIRYFTRSLIHTVYKYWWVISNNVRWLGIIMPNVWNLPSTRWINQGLWHVSPCQFALRKCRHIRRGSAHRQTARLDLPFVLFMAPSLRAVALKKNSCFPLRLTLLCAGLRLLQKQSLGCSCVGFGHPWNKWIIARDLQLYDGNSGCLHQEFTRD